MMRRLFALFFIIASLTPQAGIAFSCAMKGGPPQPHCCCDPDEAAPAKPGLATPQASCCQPVVEIADGPGDQTGGLRAARKLPDHNPQTLPPVLTPVLFCLALPIQVEVFAGDGLRHDHPYGTDLYLRTQRLRL